LKKISEDWGSIGFVLGSFIFREFRGKIERKIEWEFVRLITWHFEMKQKNTGR